MARAKVASRLTILVLTMSTLLALASPAALAQQIPSTPDPVAVSLDAGSTAVIVNDVSEQTCRPQPNCIEGVVPAVISLLGRARESGALVVFSTPATSTAPILPEVGPEPGEPVVLG